MLTLLRRAAQGEATIKDCIADLLSFIETVHPMDPESLLPEKVDGAPLLAERLTEAARHLLEAGLLVETGHGFAATKRGAQLLHQNPQGVDDTVLERFIEFRRYMAEDKTHGSAAEPTRDYKSGFTRFREGANLADNPYSRDTAAFQEWNAGWFEAFEEHLDHHRDGQHFPHAEP
jgi:hypothetical protein